jgi:hypothetical protein
MLDNEFDSLAASPSDVYPLPLGHTTSAKHFQSIAGTGTLVPRECNLLKEPVLYFYYGAPVYKLNTPLSEDDLGLPVAFLFSPRALVEVERFVPFDSGAALLGKYEGWNRVHTEIAGYFVRNRGPDTGPRLVFNLFGTNARYYKEEFLPHGTELLALRDILTLYALNLTDHRIDHRKYTIECQVLKQFNINQYLVWIGFPTALFDNFLALVKSMEPDMPEYWRYSTPRTRDPDDVSALLRTEAKRFARKYLREVPTNDIL